MTYNSTDEFFNNLLQSEQVRNTKLVDMLTLVDMGMIQSVDINGRATVISNKIIGDEPVMYRNVEVIGIGNRQGGFIADGVGCTCLILVPRSAVPSVDGDKIKWDALSYSQAGIKAIPVTSTYNATVRAGFNADGTFSIATPEYVFSVDRNSVTIGAEGITLYLDKDRNVSLFRRTTASGDTEWKLSDEGISSSFTSNNKQVFYRHEITESGVAATVGLGSPSDGKYPNTYQLEFKNGALTITHTDGDSTTYNSITIGSDGTMTLGGKGALTIQAEGDLTLEGANVAINSTEAGSTVSINGQNMVVQK